MNRYRELMNKQQEEVNALPLGFAFSNKQFAEMMQGWGLTIEDKSSAGEVMSPENMAHSLMALCKAHSDAGNGCPGCPFDKPTSNNGDGECRLGVPDSWDF